MVSIEDNELVPVAMQIIMYAGDARVKAEDALKHAKAFEFEEAHRCLKEAKELIVQAHKSQTEVIQNEASGKTYDPCFLFTHAQDTLMTIISEVRFSKELVEMFEILVKK